jgi:outer membrane protein insertion porin family
MLLLLSPTPHLPARPPPADLDSGATVPGDPAGRRQKPGHGYGYGCGVRIDTPLGPLRLEYALNNGGKGRFHLGIGHG